MPLIGWMLYFINTKGFFSIEIGDYFDGCFLAAAIDKFTGIDFQNVSNIMTGDLSFDDNNIWRGGGETMQWYINSNPK